MNDKILKMLFGIIPPEQISKALNSIMQDAIKHKKTIPLNPGETEIIMLLFEQDNIIYYSLAAVNESNTITRQITVKKLDQLIKDFINNASKQQ